jgi:hypothetical protein
MRMVITLQCRRVCAVFAISEDDKLVAAACVMRTMCVVQMPHIAMQRTGTAWHSTACGAGHLSDQGS